MIATFGWLWLLSAGCPRAPLQVTTGTAPTCPTPALDVPPSCVPAAGTFDDPFEWGIGADSDNQLWLGRLACDSGAVPTMRRLQGQTARAQPSDSPRSNVGLPTGATETLHVWSVRCPSAETEDLWVVNAYRCGALCPPDGFQLLPATAALALEEARLAMVAGDTQQINASLNAAVQSAPSFEVTHFTQGATLMALNQSEDAIAAFEAAANINPDNISGMYARIILLRSTNRAEETHGLSFRLLERTPPDHPHHPPALCMAALAHHEQGNLGEAHSLAAQSCAQGFSMCCALPAN